MKHEYIKIIDNLSIAFNSLEHLYEEDLANKVKLIIDNLEYIVDNMCPCGNPSHPDYENYCSECG